MDLYPQLLTVLNDLRLGTIVLNAYLVKIPEVVGAEYKFLK